MRWIVGIVTMLCLLGAPSAQDRRRTLDEDASSQLSAAKQLSACALARRSTPRLDAQLGAFTVAEVVALDDRPDPTCEVFERTVTEVPRTRPRAALSRGPPRG